MIGYTNVLQLLDQYKARSQTSYLLCIEVQQYHGV